jgi:Flp pilus assembly protein TadG
LRIPLPQLRRDDGQALVELALVIPLLLILLFGIVDFGIALNQYNDTTNLANLGARAVAVASSTSTNPTCQSSSGATTSLTGYLQCEGALDSVALGNVTVCPSDTSGNSWTTGDTIQVKVDDTFNWLQILFGGVGHLGGSVPSLTSTISSTATMREEADNSSEPSWVSTGASSGC